MFREVLTRLLMIFINNKNRSAATSIHHTKISHQLIYTGNFSRWQITNRKNQLYE